MWRKAENFLLKDKYLGPLVKKWGHCAIKPRLHGDYFQGLVGEIIGQQLSGKVADVIEDRFKALFKGKITPQKVLQAVDQDLRDCGMAWAKVRSIKDLAQRVKNKQLKVKQLKTLPEEEVMRELVAVKGIGPWTAEMFLMFDLGRPDVFSVGDLGIRKGVEKVTGKNLTGDKLLKFSLRWQPYRTVASWYLWRSLEKVNK